MKADLLTRISDLEQTLQALKGFLNHNEPPGLAMARLLVQLDGYAVKLAKSAASLEREAGRGRRERQGG